LFAGLIAGVTGLPGLLYQISQAYGNFSLNPFWFQNLTLSMAVIASFWAMRRPAWPPKLLTAAIAVAPTLCLIIAIVSTGPQVFFMVPAMALYGGTSLFDADRWSDDVLRIVAAALVLAVLGALGLLTYYYGLVGYTAYNFFSAEFEHYNFDSSLASTFWYSIIGRLTIILGILGAAWTAYAAVGRLRLFALTHLAVTALFLPVAYAVVHFAKNYHGSMPIYFEQCVWPYAVLFSAIAILTAIRQSARMIDWLNRRVQSIAKGSRVASGGRVFGAWAEAGRIELTALAATLAFGRRVQFLAGYVSPPRRMRGNGIFTDQSDRNNRLSSAKNRAHTRYAIQRLGRHHRWLER
jgi:hypothetical protein